MSFIRNVRFGRKELPLEKNCTALVCACSDPSWQSSSSPSSLIFGLRTVLRALSLPSSVVRGTWRPCVLSLPSPVSFVQTVRKISGGLKGTHMVNCTVGYGYGTLYSFRSVSCSVLRSMSFRSTVIFRGFSLLCAWSLTLLCCALRCAAWRRVPRSAARSPASGTAAMTPSRTR